MVDRSAVLRPVSRAPLYQRVVERLLSFIVRNGLSAGTRLPSERELATMLAVSRTSVRQAIAALESQGVVEVRHGDGTFLRHLSDTDGPMTGLAHRRRHLSHVMEARAALEVKLVCLAAIRRTDEDLAHMRQALQTMQTEMEEGGIGAEGDRLFHWAVAVAAANPVMLEIMRSLAEDIAETRFDSLSAPGRPRESLQDHHHIYDAILSQTPEAAMTAMRRHVDHVTRVGLSGWTARP